VIEMHRDRMMPLPKYQRGKVRLIRSTPHVCAKILQIPSLACWPRNLKIALHQLLLLVSRRETETKSLALNSTPEKLI